MKKILSICLAAFIAVSAFADNGTSMGFARVNHDPAALGMGGAGLVNASAYSTYSNAAALAFASYSLDAALGYQLYQPSGVTTNNISAGAAYLLSKLAFGASFTYGMCPSYTIYSNTGNERGSYTSFQMQANVGLSYKIIDCLALGLNFHYLTMNPADGYSYTSYAGDLFAQAQFSGLKVALGAVNIGTAITDSNGNSCPIASSIALGLGYDLALSDVNALNFALDADYYLSDGLAAALGAQYTWNSMVSARAGFRYGGQSVVPTFATVGLGCALKGIRLDLAYLLPVDSNSALSNTITVGLGYRF